MFKPLALLLVLPLAGCDDHIAAVLTGKPTPAQIAYEAVAPVAVFAAPVVVAEVEADPVEVEPVCIIVFRVEDCAGIL